MDSPPNSGATAVVFDLDRPIPELDTRSRTVLADLADVVVPAGDGFPSAGEAGVAGTWIGPALRARPDRRVVLGRILDEAYGHDPFGFVADLQLRDPDGFAVLVEAVTGAYFLNPEVRTAYGYQGQAKVPFDPDLPDYADLLPDVLARGPIYRCTG